LPESGRQIALDLQMIQLQLNEGNTSRKVPLNVAAAYVQSGNSAAFALCFDYHVACSQRRMIVSLWTRVA
jgi:hypothetical protein